MGSQGVDNERLLSRNTGKSRSVSRIQVNDSDDSYSDENMVAMVPSTNAATTTTTDDSVSASAKPKPVKKTFKRRPAAASSTKMPKKGAAVPVMSPRSPSPVKVVESNVSEDASPPSYLQSVSDEETDVEDLSSHRQQHSTVVDDNAKDDAVVADARANSSSSSDEDSDSGLSSHHRIAATSAPFKKPRMSDDSTKTTKNFNALANLNVKHIDKMCRVLKSTVKSMINRRGRPSNVHTLLLPRLFDEEARIRQAMVPYLESNKNTCKHGDDVEFKKIGELVLTLAPCAIAKLFVDSNFNQNFKPFNKSNLELDSGVIAERADKGSFGEFYNISFVLELMVSYYKSRNTSGYSPDYIWNYQCRLLLWIHLFQANKLRNLQYATDILYKNLMATLEQIYDDYLEVKDTTDEACSAFVLRNLKQVCGEAAHESAYGAMLFLLTPQYHTKVGESYDSPGKTLATLAIHEYCNSTPEDVLIDITCSEMRELYTVLYNDPSTIETN